MGWQDAPVVEDQPGGKQPAWMGAPEISDKSPTISDNSRQSGDSRLESFKAGLKDPITGAAQLLTHILPEKAVEAGNELNNWMAKYGLTKAIPTATEEGQPVKGSKAMDTLVNQEEQALEAQRQAAGRTDTDWYRILGNVASPTNLVGAGAALKGAQGAGLAGRAAAGAAQGAATSLAAPVTGEGDYWAEKGKQAAVGGGIGAAAPVLTGAAARIIKPISSDAVRKLTEAGVSLTPGQVLGGGFQRAEDAASSLPLVGDIVKSAQRRGIQSFNEAVGNEALAPIGQKLPKGASGNEAVKYVRQALGDAYDDLLPKLKGDLNAPHSVIPQNGVPVTFRDELEGVRSLGKNLPKQQQRDLNRIIDEEVIGKFTRGGVAAGETLQAIKEKLKNEVEDLSKSVDPYHRKLSTAIKEIDASMRRMINDVNPKYAGELSKIDRGYATFKQAQRAASSVGAPEGVFTPAQYLSAVKVSDKTKDKRAFSEGEALGQELAAAGKQVLSQKVPDSGTAIRELMTGAGGAGIGATLGGLPGIAAALAAPVMYSQPGTQLMRAVLTQRPQGAQALSGMVRQGAPLITAGAVPISQLMNGTQGQ